MSDVTYSGHFSRSKCYFYLISISNTLLTLTFIDNTINYVSSLLKFRFIPEPTNKTNYVQLI